MTPTPRTPLDKARRLSTAPMIMWSTRHARYLWRLLSRHALLYTEMVTTGALRYGPRDQLLAHHPAERPLALQMGGAEPKALAECARMAEDAGFDEVNLNVGCPSDRVQTGHFGACLMLDPSGVARSVEAMRAAVDRPVTVKHRIGVDHQVPEQSLPRFLRALRDAGCDHVIIHARKAWLQGLDPKANRNVPPLRYALVRDMKRAFPTLGITVNGGIHDLETAAGFLEQGFDGVMMGRAVYNHPSLLAAADRRIFGDVTPDPDPRAVVLDYAEYAEAALAEGATFRHLVPPLLGLFPGRPGARRWRRHLSEAGSEAGPETIREALEHLHAKPPGTRAPGFEEAPR